MLVWGLILWCVVVYRRRRDDDPLPLQVRYNLPIEILYTALPLMMVGVLFFFTARDEAAIAATDHTPDLHHRRGRVKQWSWDFNYVDADVWDAGVQGELHGKPGVEKELPTLYLPVNERVAVRADLAATSSTRSGCRRSCSRWTSSRAGRTSSR